MDQRILGQLQHAIIGGPAFEMDTRSRHTSGRYDGTEDYNDCAIRRDIAYEQGASERDRVQAETGVRPETPGQPAETAITAAEACKRFVLAGKAIFTLQGANSRYTFRINRAEPKPGTQYTSAAYFVSLLTGPDNLSDYTYLGLLHWSTGEVRITRSSKYRVDSAPVLAINWAFRHIWAGRTLPAPAVFYHIGRCARCGRALTVPSSIESGVGPECAGKMDGI